VLYEMLTGVPPFQADTPHGYLLLHASERPRALREVNPTVPESPELESVIFRSMEKDRTNRFTTAREFAVALEQLLPTLATEPGARAIPRAAEATEEPTRVVARSNDESATMVSASQVAETEVKSSLAPTIETENVAAPTVVTSFNTVEVAAGADAPQRSWRVPAVAAIVAIILIAAGISMFRHRGETASAAVATPVQASVVATVPGRIGIQAYPWANVTSIRNLQNGEPVRLSAPLVTPAPLDLAPGTYEITLSNPVFSKSIVKTIEVKPGEEQMINVAFSDASRAPLPNFGGTLR
jgi:hypothetical protein